MTFAARIRSVRMKNGGATVRVLHTPQPNDGENWNGKMVENAKAMAGQGDVTGYVVLAFYADGTRSAGFRMTPLVPRELFPSYVAEILRRDAITEYEAEMVFDRKFEWRDE